MRKRINRSELVNKPNSKDDGTAIQSFSQFPYGKDVLTKTQPLGFDVPKIALSSDRMEYNEGLDFNEEKYFFSLMEEAFK